MTDDDQIAGDGIVADDAVDPEPRKKRPYIRRKPASAAAEDIAVQPARMVLFRGETVSTADLAERFSMAVGCLEFRLDRGLSVERAIFGVVQ